MGPDWARVWTFPVGRKKRERVHGDREESVRDIRETTTGEEGRIASRVGRIGSRSEKFMAGASTYEREVLHPGPTGRGS